MGGHLCFSFQWDQLVQGKTFAFLKQQRTPFDEKKLILEIILHHVQIEAKSIFIDVRASKLGTASDLGSVFVSRQLIIMYRSNLALTDGEKLSIDQTSNSV